MASFALIEVAASAETALLPHSCSGVAAEAPIAYRIGPRGRARLAEGETVPATARCPRCDGRVFASLIDPAARGAARAAARPDPTALRAPRPPPGQRQPQAPILRPRLRIVPPPAREPCPACGAVPDDAGLCRCSL